MNNLVQDLSEVIPYTYKALRIRSFEDIICKFLDNTKSSKFPVFIHMLGIPGAGKSTFYCNNAEKFQDYLYVSFDDIMMAHPQYQKDIENLGPIDAFNKWELPARIAGYELLFRAISARKNIFFDHGGTPQCHMELLIKLKQIGYTTKMYYISCPVEEAIKRAKEREVLTKRHTPVQLIIDRHKLIENNIETYKEIVDEFISVN